MPPMHAPHTAAPNAPSQDAAAKIPGHMCSYLSRLLIAVLQSLGDDVAEECKVNREVAALIQERLEGSRK
jgi:hypothetical protein